MSSSVFFVSKREQCPCNINCRRKSEGYHEYDFVYETAKVIFEAVAYFLRYNSITTKDQLISKGLFGVLKSTKKSTKFFKDEIK
jgi:hypothetical protein